MVNALKSVVEVCGILCFEGTVIDIFHNSLYFGRIVYLSTCYTFFCDNQSICSNTMIVSSYIETADS